MPVFYTTHLALLLVIQTAQTSVGSKLPCAFTVEPDPSPKDRYIIPHAPAGDDYILEAGALSLR